MDKICIILITKMFWGTIPKLNDNAQNLWEPFWTVIALLLKAIL